MKKSIIILFLFNIVFSQTKQISQISISSKKNGISINILSDIPLDKSQVTGWYNDTNSWYYMTIHNATGDVIALEKTRIEYPISNIEIVNTGESIQIGFKMKLPVEEFEFYFDDSSSRLLVALRFPLSNVLASIEAERPNRSNKKNVDDNRPRSWIKGLYFTGSSIVGVGLLKRNNQKGWEIPVGFSLILIAYCYEQFIIYKAK